MAERAGFPRDPSPDQLRQIEGASWPTVACTRPMTASHPMGPAGGYEFDDDPTRIDVDAVWRFLSSHAYWGRWRVRTDVVQQVEGAWRAVGCYDVASGTMVGFARAISDGVGLAYLADVYIEPAHRGRGLGKRLVETMIDAGPGADFRWLLHTADAHGLYAQFGFRPADETLLELPHASTRPAPSAT